MAHSLIGILPLVTESLKRPLVLKKKKTKNFRSMICICRTPQKLKL